MMRSQFDYSSLVPGENKSTSQKPPATPTPLSHRTTAKMAGGNICIRNDFTASAFCSEYMGRPLARRAKVQLPQQSESHQRHEPKRANVICPNSVSKGAAEKVTVV